MYSSQHTGDQAAIIIVYLDSTHDGSWIRELSLSTFRATASYPPFSKRTFQKERIFWENWATTPASSRKGWLSMRAGYGHKICAAICSSWSLKRHWEFGEILHVHCGYRKVPSPVSLATRTFALSLSKWKPYCFAFAVLMRSLLCLHHSIFSQLQLFASAIQSLSLRWIKLSQNLTIGSGRTGTILNPTLASSPAKTLALTPLCHGTKIRVPRLTVTKLFRTLYQFCNNPDLVV